MGNQSSFRNYLAEFFGTAILLLIGLSLVIFMFGEGSPAGQIIPNYKLRQCLTGFLFGCVGASIALSPIGKASCAHINPAVTLAFRLFGKIDLKTSLGYIIAQLSGAVVGCLPLLFWGTMGQSIYYGGTMPGNDYSILTVLLGEIITTFCLVTGLCLFLGFHKIRRFTPFMIPFLYAIMVPLKASIIGTLLASFACSALAKKITEAKLYHFDSEQDRLLRR
jgi:aquaporin Z